MKEETKKTKIKNWLLSGKPITPIMALQMFHCFRLASVIHKLKNNDNMMIKTEIIRQCDGTVYAKYYLEKHG